MRTAHRGILPITRQSHTKGRSLAHQQIVTSIQIVLSVDSAAIIHLDALARRQVGSLVSGLPPPDI